MLGMSTSRPNKLGAVQESGKLKQRRAALYPLAGLVSAFVMSAPAQACDHWEMPAKLYLSQSNNAMVYIEGGLIGHAKTATQLTFAEMHEYNYNIKFTGDVDGTLTGSALSFTIHWMQQGDVFGLKNDYSTGVYTGTIRPTGRLEGSAYDAEHPDHAARWFAEDRLVCAPPDAGPPKPPPVTLGRVQLPSGPATGPDIQRFFTVCERARDARKNNRPTAAAMEALCARHGEDPGNIVKVDVEPIKVELKPAERLDVIPGQHVEVSQPQNLGVTPH